MFFIENRQYFFRPFAGKYREQVMECLRILHSRLYGDQADYSRAFTQEQLLESFEEAIARTPVLDEDDATEYTAPSKNEREQAHWVRNILLEHGWLECHADEMTLQSTYSFSRIGRLFTQPMVETAAAGFRTRHRNTRNTRNALQSFVERGDVYDLLDAYEASARIISDFSDVIAELDERKRQLVKEIEAQQLIQQASDEFFDFMEQRFMPDLAIRMSTDSVEKHRDEIQQLIAKARRKQTEFKANAEGELRKMAPELRTADNASVYLRILDGIEGRIHSASEIMLPALRESLHSFTRRADIIIRQLSYNSYSDQGGLPALCQALAEMPAAEKQAKLQAMADAMAGLSLGFVDPAAMKLHNISRKRLVNSGVESHEQVNKDSRKAIFIQQVLEKAFQVNSHDQMQYIVAALQNGHRIHSHHLPVNNARELLMAAHAIEIAAAGNNSSEFSFQVRYVGQTTSTEYYDQTDEFIIELVEKNQ
ncbi:MAG: flagellar protein FliT [Gammaproteobacteria bacterium]|nr:flagellar protein FliT [Gammaproteobacteria bacterium]